MIIQKLKNLEVSIEFYSSPHTNLVSVASGGSALDIEYG